jgi:two-component system KDP operon response regulator KdpE
VLLSRVWGRDAGDEVDYLKTFIYRLRHKIEPDPAQPRYLHTERSVGYWLDNGENLPP